MKKLMLAVLVLISLTEAANAQKGSYLLYGNVGFTSSTDYYGGTSNTYVINPGIGYQFSNNWTLGLNIAVGGTRQQTEIANVSIDGYSNTNYFNVGPFLRRAYSISNIFSVYGQLEVNYLSGTTNPYLLSSGSYSGFGTDLFPAIGINIKNGWALNLAFGGISYQTKSYKGDYYANNQTVTNSPTNQFAVTFGQSAIIGISKNFGPKK
jgi:hypothetical protein